MKVSFRVINPRISVKERNLIKGAIRRVFSRSDLRREVLNSAVVEHSDPERKRVKTWVKCAECGTLDAKTNMQVDHIDPVVPLDSALEHMTWDDLVNRVWCDRNSLQVLCLSCHNVKTKEESKLRRAYKKGKSK
jgi:5-methylcytosine-specific restriction endonuclease McrA